MGVNFFSCKIGHGVQGLRVWCHKIYVFKFLNISLTLSVFPIVQPTKMKKHWTWVERRDPDELKGWLNIKLQNDTKRYKVRQLHLEYRLLEASFQRGAWMASPSFTAFLFSSAQILAKRIKIIMKFIFKKNLIIQKHPIVHLPTFKITPNKPKDNQISAFTIQLTIQLPIQPICHPKS